LLSRFELDVTSTFDKETPSRANVQEALAKNLKVDKSLIVVKEIDTAFGESAARIRAYQYLSMDERNRLEPRLAAAEAEAAKAEEKKKAEEKEEGAKEKGEQSEPEKKEGEDKKEPIEKTDDKKESKEEKKEESKEDKKDAKEVHEKGKEISKDDEKMIENG